MTLSSIFDGVIDEDISVKPPIAVLKELAQELAKITKGLLVGKVEQTIANNGSFDIYFYINAPSLNNYSCFLVRISHGLKFYPLSVINIDNIVTNRNVTNQDEFEKILKDIISLPQTKKIINGLLAQIKSSN